MLAPRILVFAGPNGSGKSTITRRCHIVGFYVNADEIANVRNCPPLQAAEIATATLQYLVAQELDFTMETVLSTYRNIELLEGACQKGYEITCIYVLTKNPSINADRVETRVIAGKHPVQPREGETMREAVIRRYYNAMRLIPALCKVCSRILFYDNTPERGQGEPDLIAEINEGNAKIFPSSLWTEEEIENLLAGKYLLNSKESKK